jgi:hypothetical protein
MATKRTKTDTSPIRIYRESSDKQGTVMCQRHAEATFRRNPAAFACGEHGGTCEPCQYA